MEAADQRLAAIGAAAATVLSGTPYHSARAEAIAAAVELPGGAKKRGRSAVWLYNEVKSRRVLVGLAAFHAWEAFRVTAASSPPEAPQPRTVTEARQNLVSALTRVIEFHRAESDLMVQVGHGIGDIATAEKRRGGAAPATPEWPMDSPWGRVADDAWHSRLGVHADFLTPVIRAATRVVTLLPEQEIRRGARLLSDLAFRTWLADQEGPVEATADGLAAMWFERQLVHAAGPWVRELEGAERTYAATRRHGTNPRAEVAGHSALARVLMNAGTLHRRAAAEGERIIAALTTLTGWPVGRTVENAPSPGDEGAVRTDLAALTDATSRQALVMLRYGDLEAARREWELSRDVARRGLGGDESRVARADGNLAVVLSLSGRPLTAFDQIHRVLRTRTRLAENADGESGWRRCTITHNDQAMVAYRAGRVVQAVRLATALLADRQAHSAGESVNTAEARFTLGRALLAAGHPTEAHSLIEEAHQYCRTRFVSTGFRLQDDVVSLARVALVRNDPGGALSLIDDAVAHTEWFAEHVSFRLSYQARRLRSIALARLGDVEQALRLLNDHLARLRRLLGTAGSDPLVLDYRHAIVETLLHAGELSGAVAELRAAEGFAEDLPRHGRTLLLRARLAAATGDEAAERAVREGLAELVTRGLSRTHPLVLAARYELVVRHEEAIFPEGNDDLAPILDRTPLAHGRPALGDGHPLLIAARDLVARVTAQRQRPAEEDLPWDISEDHG